MARIYPEQSRKTRHTPVIVALILAVGWVGYGWVTKPLPVRMHVKSFADGFFIFDAVTDAARFCRIGCEDVWCSPWSRKQAVEIVQQ